MIFSKAELEVVKFSNDVVTASAPASCSVQGQLEEKCDLDGLI